MVLSHHSPQQAFQNSIIQAAIPIYEGKLNHDEDSGLTFRIYSFEVNSINARKAIQDELSNFVRSPAILACFYSPRDTSAFRLSLITRSIDEEGKLTPNSFRRQSFILGENQKIKTALTQLSALKKPTFDSLKEAFSLEPVTKEFFEKITLHFEEIASALTFPDGIKDIDRAHRFTLRFISRILFCKFLEKKGIIPESLLSSPQSFKPDFYASILEPLFFSTLNAPKEERQALDSVFFSIPYLNGGLFSPQEEDYQGKMQIPDAVLEKFLKMLGEFNFTTDESTLNDQEIALDPEMLGKVFEGLLSKISGEEKKAKPAKAESKTNQRKQTGSFYTPREIVDHMVKSSIFTYLKHKQLTSDQALKEFIFEHKCPFSKDSIPHIIEALKAFKVIDPACGSGAFSIGMLNEMCALLEILDPNAETFKQSSEKNSKSPSYTRKLFILKNNIFGVDIQPMAIEIARLRCFLSLIIDEDKDNISPLPNIDINIKCGNSLVSNFELEEHDGLGNPKYHTLAWLIRKDSSFSNNFKEQMKQYKHNVALYKEALGDKKHITQSITKIKDFFRESLLRVSPINEEIDKKLGNFVRTYGDASFDLGSDFGLEMKKRIARKATFAFQPNLQPNSKPKPIDKKGQELFDSLYKDYQELESLRHSQTFEWRFEFPEVLSQEGDFLGFDCVIGNPPYIRQEAIKELKPFLQKSFSIYASTSDIYTYFFEQGYKLLSPQGILAFITSNKWTRAGYGEKLRRFLLKETTLLGYIELNGVKIFESASVDTSIISFSKCKAKEDSRFAYAHPKTYNPSKPLQSYLLDSQPIAQSSLSTDAFTFGDNAMQELKAKIESIGTPLKDWDIEIKRGVLTGYNEAFIISSQKREEILNACDNGDQSLDENGLNERERTEELIKPVLRGRDIKRYSYQWAEKWLIGTFPARHLDIEKYPALKAYLESFLPRINQSGEKGCRKKTSNQWFETQDNIAYWQDFAKEKIVWNPVSGEYLFAHIKETFYFNNSLFMITSKEGKEKFLLFVLGLMNSFLYRWLMMQITNLVEEGKYAYGAKDKIELLPIPKNLAPQIVNEIETLAQKILDAKFQEPDSDTKTLESRLDHLVYQLYNLSDDEISLIESELINGGGVIAINELYALLREFLARDGKTTPSTLSAPSLAFSPTLGHSDISPTASSSCDIQDPQTPHIPQYEGKIIWAEMTKEPCFVYENQGMFINQTCYFIPKDDVYLCAVLNSKMIYFYMRQTASKLGNGALRWIKQFVETIPVLEQNAKNSQKIEKIRALAKERGNAKAEKAQELESQIDHLIYELYDLDSHQIELIESEFLTGGGR